MRPLAAALPVPAFRGTGFLGGPGSLVLGSGLDFTHAEPLFCSPVASWLGPPLTA